MVFDDLQLSRLAAEIEQCANPMMGANPVTESMELVEEMTTYAGKIRAWLGGLATPPPTEEQIVQIAGYLWDYGIAPNIPFMGAVMGKLWRAAFLAMVRQVYSEVVTGG